MERFTERVSIPLWLLIVIILFIFAVVVSPLCKAEALTADINKDGIVNFVDLALLAQQFGQTEDPSIEIDGIYVLTAVRNSRGPLGGYSGFFVKYKETFFIEIILGETRMPMYGFLEMSGDLWVLQNGSARQTFKFRRTDDGIVLKDGSMRIWIEMDFKRITGSRGSLKQLAIKGRED